MVQLRTKGHKTSGVCGNYKHRYGFYCSCNLQEYGFKSRSIYICEPTQLNFKNGDQMLFEKGKFYTTEDGKLANFKESPLPFRAGYWVSGDIANMDDLGKCTSLNDLGNLLQMLPHIDFDSNGRLLYSRLPDVSNAIVGKFIELGAIKKVSQGYHSQLKFEMFDVFINEDYHKFSRMGDLENIKPFIKIYIAQLEKATKTLSNESLGLLYKLIPYMNNDHLYLSFNTNESELSNLNTLQLKDIEKLSKLDTNATIDLINELRLASILSVTTINNKDTYVINPDIAYPENKYVTDNLEDVYKLFKGKIKL